MQQRMPVALFAVSLVALVTACTGGGGGGGGYNPGTVTSTPTPTATTSSQQVVRLALPTTGIGTENDPVFGLVGGFTQNTFSQVLAFVPGAQIMIQNGQSTTPHTLGDTGGTSSFPASAAALSFTAAGGSTISHGFQTGTINANALIGPFTLAAGTYYIGCAYHYASNQMRDVLLVAANATPGPQATQPAGSSTPNPGVGGGGYGP